jgi:putative methionine-R-sulfoxide reductase with GAF domain
MNAARTAVIVETLTVPEEKEKLVFDEQTLDKLLEAAFVLQEHNRSLRELDLKLQLKRDQVEASDRASSPPVAPPRILEVGPSNTPQDYTLTLGKIVETQHHIQVRKLGLDEAMSLVAQRVMEIGATSGAAIALVNRPSVRYAAVAGAKALAAGTIVPVAKALCSACVRTAQVVRCLDVALATDVDAAECRRRGIQSLIVAPIFHEGEVAGALEVYYSTPHAFTDQDVHTCQLMAGLVTEALVREEEHTWKKSLATERAAMLDALEKLQPNLAALVGKSATQSGAQKEEADPALTSESTISKCRKCGHQLLEKEQFCGECGLPRSGDYERPSMQSKVASLWELQESAKTDTNGTSISSDGGSSSSAPKPARSNFEIALARSVEHTAPNIANSAEPLEASPESGKSVIDVLESELEENTIDHEVPAVEDEEKSGSDESPSRKLTVPADWSSAAAAREFLEQLASGNRSRSLVQFWNSRRGDIYLAIAVILVACVIRWGVWSNHSTTGPGTQTPTVAAHKKAGPDADLSFFDRMLIKLGLADAPEPPEDTGNPGVQVWIDERTALYYCPGTDLYGKTPKGRFTTQREAQLDQFEPAYRKACN